MNKYERKILSHIEIKLPNGDVKLIEAGISAAEAVGSFSQHVAKEMLAVKINGQLRDVSCIINENCELEAIMPESDEGKDILNHSTAHLLAQAIKIQYPHAQIVIGPVIEDGFYYDIAVDKPILPEDLVALEKIMTDLSKKSQPVSRHVWSRDKALEYFKSIGEDYKCKITRYFF